MHRKNKNNETEKTKDFEKFTVEAWLENDKGVVKYKWFLLNMSNLLYDYMNHD